MNDSIVEQADVPPPSERTATTADSRPDSGPANGGLADGGPANGQPAASQHDWQGALPPSLPPPLASTPAPPPAARRLDQTSGRNFIQELEQSIFPLEETCKKCGEKVINTDALQDHIISKHCLQYPQLVKLLEEQRVVLSCLVKEQDKQTVQMTDIVRTQNCIISDVKQLKVQHDNKTRSSVSAVPPRPAAVQQTAAAPSAPSQPNAPLPLSPTPSQMSAGPLVTYAGMAGSEAVGQGRSDGREAAGQGRNVTARKIAYITDSIGGNVH